MFNKSIFKALGVAAMLMVSGSAMAGHNGPHYAKFTATSTGNGKVYVSTSSTAEAVWSETTSEATWQCANQTGASDNASGYFKAQPNDGYIFSGWYAGNEAALPTSTSAEYTATLSAESTNQSAPTSLALEARFVQLTVEISEIALTGEHLYLVCGDKYFNKSDDSFVVPADAPMQLTISQAADTKYVTLATDTRNSVYDAGNYEIKVGASSLNNFIFSGNNEDGYKIYIPNDLNWALGIDNGFIKLVSAASAPLWKIGKMDEVSATVGAANAAKYATFCAPFDVTITNNYVTAATCEGVTAEDNTVLELTATANGGKLIPANTPVILTNSRNQQQTITAYGISKPVANPTFGLLTGVYEDTTAPDGSYVLQTQSGVTGFYVVEDVKPEVKANHAYLTAPAGVDSRIIGFDAQATAIESLDAKGNVDGKFVEKNNIVIVKNGKKFNTVGQRVK